jgi:hypothetical protein
MLHALLGAGLLTVGTYLGEKYKPQETARAWVLRVIEAAKGAKDKFLADLAQEAPEE